MSIDIEKERPGFEAWFSDGGKFPKAVERSGDGYMLLQAQQAWTAWQAARATPQAPTPVAAELQEGWQAVPKVLRQPMSEAIDHAMSLGSNQHLWDCALAAAPLPRQAAVQGDSDAKRLDDLETLCWSPNIGNGLVLWAGTKNMEGERKQLYWVQDMGDEDGSNLGNQIGEGVTLRAAIDQAIATMATAPDQAKSAPATTEKGKS